MEMIKKISKRVCQVLILILVFQVVYKGTFSLGTALANTPDQVVLNLGGDDTPSANLFNNEDGRFWYPGFSEESILRIVNSHNEDVSVYKFGMDLKLTPGDDNETSTLASDVEAEYLSKMNIQLHHNDPENDSKRLLYSGTFSQFVNDGYDGGSVAIDSDSAEDVVYTISMDEDASKYICNIHADIEFTFQVDGEDSGSGGGDGPTRKSDPVEEFVEIEEETVPLGVFSKLFMGYPDGTMNVNKTMNRAELACIIYRALNMEPLTEWDIVFRDDTQWWYDKEARSVIGAGYMALEDVPYPLQPTVEGNVITDKSYFNGTKLVTRQDLADILTRVFKQSLMNKTERLSFTEYSKLYTTLMNDSSVITADMLRQIMLNQSDIQGDFAEQVEAQRLLFTNPESNLAMNLPVTRLEVAKIFYRILYLNTPAETAETTDIEVPANE